MKKSLFLIVAGLVLFVDLSWVEATKTNSDIIKAKDKIRGASDATVIEQPGSRRFEVKKTVEKIQGEEIEWFKKGYNASMEKNYDEAIEYYKKAIVINSNYADAHANLGVTYIQKGKFDEAISNLKQAITIDQKNVGAHYNLGLVYDKKGKIDEAILEYEKTIDINPSFAKAYQNLGIAYFEKNLKSMAAECFYKASLLFLEQSNIEKALQAFDALTLTESKELEQALSEKLFPEQNQKKSETSK